MPNWRRLKRSTYYSYEKFISILNGANDSCMKMNVRPEIVKKERIKALRTFKDLIRKVNTSYVEANHAIKLIGCALTLIEYFHFDINAMDCTTHIPKKKLKLLDEAFSLFSKIVKKLSNHSYTLYGTIFTFITDAKLWATECLGANIMKRLKHIRYFKSKLPLQLFFCYFLKNFPVTEIKHLVY